MAGQCCFGNNRPFDVEILDHTNREVIHVTRPLTCWLSEVEVCASDGQLFGLVEKEATFLHPNYLIKNHYGEGVLRIKGPLVQSHLLGNIEFTVKPSLQLNKDFKCVLVRIYLNSHSYHLQIKQMDGAEIGKISKKWTGLAQELFTDASHFGISFPLDLDVRMKAVLLGACLLIVTIHFLTHFLFFTNFFYFCFCRTQCTLKESDTRCQLR